MQRILTALVALISLCSLSLRVTFAQTANGQAVEPTSAPTEINEPANGHHDRVAPRASSSQSLLSVEPGQTERIGPDETVNDVSVREGRLILEGHVTHDVLAIKSRVTVKSGATVGGHIVAVGGEVDNEAGKAVSVVEQDSALTSAPLAGMLASTPAPPAQTIIIKREAAHKPGDWFGGQMALLAFGLVVGLALLIVAPRATQQAAASVGPSAARSLVVGGIGGLGLLFAQVVNCGLLKSPIETLWAPFGLALALGSAALLVCGWICGMHFAGDMIAHALGRPVRSGNLYRRAALGLAAFFVLNCALGIMHSSLVVIGLMLECVVALMGLGGIFITGFGADPDWLTLRLQRRASWFSWSRKSW